MGHNQPRARGTPTQPQWHKTDNTNPTATEGEADNQTRDHYETAHKGTTVTTNATGGEADHLTRDQRE